MAIVTSSNLPITKIFFFLFTNNNLSLMICCKGVMKMLLIWHFSQYFGLIFNGPIFWRNQILFLIGLNFLFKMFKLGGQVFYFFIFF